MQNASQEYTKHVRVNDIGFKNQIKKKSQEKCTKMPEEGTRVNVFIAFRMLRAFHGI